MYKVSVAVPVFEYYGRGIEMLNDMFISINKQTLESIQVVISDHSKDNKIENFCKIVDKNFDLKYIKNNNNYGNPAHNTNNAIENSDGEIIKIMQQDDFFYNKNALKKIYDSLSNSSKMWSVCGAIHTYDDGSTYTRPMIPNWVDSMIISSNNNHIGGVSVLSIKNTASSRFDFDLRMLLDIDIYYNLKINYGYPQFIDDLLICNRARDYDTLSAEISEDETNLEFEYFHKKYGLVF